MTALTLPLTLTLTLPLAATRAAHATTRAIGGMLHLALATALAVAHAAAISRPPCLGRASGDKAGRCQGQGEEVVCFHAVVPFEEWDGFTDLPPRGDAYRFGDPILPREGIGAMSLWHPSVSLCFS